MITNLVLYKTLALLGVGLLHNMVVGGTGMEETSTALGDTWWCWGLLVFGQGHLGMLKGCMAFVHTVAAMMGIHTLEIESVGLEFVDRNHGK